MAIYSVRIATGANCTLLISERPDHLTHTETEKIVTPELAEAIESQLRAVVTAANESAKHEADHA